MTPQERQECEAYLQFIRPWDDAFFKVLAIDYVPKRLKDGTANTANKRFVMARGASSYVDIVNCVEHFSSRGSNIWFASQSYRPPVKPNYGKYDPWCSNPSRLQEDMVENWNLYADLDVKPTGYSDLASATQALWDFCGKTGLPLPSWVVASGYGMHPYWRMPKGLSLGDYLPLADALANALTQEGIKCDSGVTRDAVRILRVPGTTNYKDPVNPKPVYNLTCGTKLIYPVAQLETALQPYRVAAAKSFSPGINFGPLPQGFTKSTVNQNLMAGVDSQPVNLKEVAQDCPLFAAEFASAGAQTSQPLWALIGMASVFDATPEQTFHDLSKGYPQYDHNEMLKKLDEKRRANLRGTGWPSCLKFSNESPICQTCPHFAVHLKEGKSPLHLRGPAQRRHIPVPPHLIPGVKNTPPNLPPGYFHNADASVWTEEILRNGEKKWVPVLDNYPIGDGNLVDTGELTFWTRVGGVDRQVIITDDNLDQLKQREKLQGQRVYLQEEYGKRVVRFFVAWKKHLHDITDRPRVSVDQIGWGSNDHSFSFGGKVFDQGLERAALYRNGSALRDFEAVGKPKPWENASEFVSRYGGVAMQALVATSFAGPLVSLFGAAGSPTVSFYSQNSGRGKTTGMRIAQAVWGHPVRAMNSVNPTETALIIKLGAVRHLTLYWDEVKTRNDRDKLVSICFSLGQGITKARANRDAGLKDVYDFKLMLVAATNISLSEVIVDGTMASDAGALRVFEMEMPPLADSGLTSFQVDQMLASLDGNYGHAGMIYAKWLSQNAATAKKMLRDVANYFAVTLKVTTMERYWLTTITTIMAGAALSNQIGLTKFDLIGLRNFLLSEFRRIRGDKTDNVVSLSSSSDVEDILGDLIADDNVCLPTDILSGHGGVNAVVLRGNWVARDLILKPYLWAQFAEDLDILRVRRKDFARWCASRGISMKALVEQLVAKGAIPDKSGHRGQIGAGIAHNSIKSLSRARCFDIAMVRIRH